MFRLLCVSGDSLGKTYLLKAGINTIGRKDADILVPSNGVSKQHAKILVDEDNAKLVDLDSKNGTFINGLMIKEKKLKTGDKIGIYNTVFQFEKVNIGADNQGLGGFNIDEDLEYESKEKYRPIGIVASFNDFIDKSLMPFFESMIKKYPISFVSIIIILSLTTIVTLLVTYPIITYDKYILEKESSLRGIYLSNLLASSNKEAIDLTSNIEPSINSVASVPGVKMAFVIDVEGMILAPAEYEGQVIPANILARTSKIIKGEIKVSDIKEGNLVNMEGGADLYKIKSGEYWVTSPIEVYSRERGENVIAGFAVINFVTSTSKLSSTSSWQRIIIGIVIAGFIGFIVAIIFSRLFNIPFIRLYDEVDLTYKGETRRITYNLGSKYARDLIDLLNIVLKKSKRVSAKSGSVDDIDLFSKSKEDHDEIEVMSAIGNSLKNPFFIIDTTNIIVTANKAFNDISSFKSMDWNNVPIVDAVSDQNLLGSILGLITKYQDLREDVSDEIFINDKPFRISVNGIKNNKGVITYFCISVEMV